MEQYERSRQTTIIVLASLIIILGLSSLILFFQNRLLRQQMKPIEKLTTPTPSPTSHVYSPYIEDSINYVNEKYDFTLTSLPKNLKMIVCGDIDQGDDPKTANDIWFMEPSIINYYKERDKAEEGYLICGPIDSQRGPIGITIEEKEFVPTTDSKEIIVSGVKAYQTNTKNSGGPGPDQIITTQFSKNNFTFSITLYLNKNEYVNEYDQILSTFKFIN